MRKAIALLTLAALGSVASGQESRTSDAGQSASRPRIGLALGGGGALGMAHIGVLRWFEENHIPVDAIAGTSMGAMVGALYATRHTTAQMRQLVDPQVFGRVFTISSDYQSLNSRRREDRRQFPQSLSLGLRHGVQTRDALLTDQGLNAVLDASFVDYSDQQDFDGLPIPFRCLATDLVDGQPKVFAHGDLADSVRASVALPSVFSPVARNGHLYVDGGVIENLPTQTVKDMHVDVVVGVSLPLSKFDANEPVSIVGVLSRSFSVAIEANEARQRKLADVLIMPDTRSFASSDYDKRDELIRIGYDAAQQMGAALRRYALDDADWAVYLAARASRQPPRAGVLRVAKTESPSPGAARETQRVLKSEFGKQLDPAVLEEKLNLLRGDGSYQVDYHTFFSGLPAPTMPKGQQGQRKTNAVSPEKGVRDVGVLVRLTPQRYAPPYLLLGGDVTAVSGGVARQTFQARYVHQDLGGYGSELRAIVKLGFLTDLSAEYYWRLTSSGIFVAPHIAGLRQPVYIYSNQRRIAERFQQDAGGGLDVGISPGPRTELRASWQDATVRWETRLGSDGGKDFSGTAQQAGIAFVFDGQDRAVVPHYGVLVNAKAGYLYHAVASNDAPLVEMKASIFHTFSEKNILGVAMSGGSAFGRRIGEPFKFTLGGPLRLSASQIDEYRGTDYYVTSAGYLRRIATAPRPLGAGIYATFAYEAGEVFDPTRRTLLRQDGVLGIVAETPLGALSFGGAVGDAGHRKIVFSVGKLF